MCTKVANSSLYQYASKYAQKAYEQDQAGNYKSAYNNYVKAAEILQQLIGFTSINDIDLRNLRAEWGGTLIGEKKYIGKGIGKEASKLMLSYLFNQYPIRKCYAYCLEQHPATKKLFESLGFKKDGVLREHIYKDGSFKSLLIYSILKEEFNADH